MGAQVGDMAHAGALGLVQELGDDAGEVGTHHGRHEIDACDALHGARERRGVVPVEVDVRAAASCPADRNASLEKLPGDASSGLAGGAEDEDAVVVEVVHVVTPG